MAYAAIANNGVLMQPRLVRAMRDAKGTLRDKNDPKPVRRVISEQTAAAMRAMLAEVVTNGTGKIAAVKGYRVAGKTGTANKYKKGMYIGSFVGFLPASAAATPKAVILVAVDVPKGAYYGAEVAAPVFQAIARRLMDTWHVPQDDPQGEQYRMAHERLKLQRRGLEETARAR
jgi:stage V sporulation protein D (sporulation-specific penicillin-binding protein)